MKIKVYQTEEEEKCPSCNWGTTVMYSVDESPARRCANCFMDFIIANELELTKVNGE